jgi:hypothetical protein
MTPRANPGRTLTNLGFSKRAAAAAPVEELAPAVVATEAVEAANAAAPRPLRSSLLVLADPFSFVLERNTFSNNSFKKLDPGRFEMTNSNLLT